METPSILSIFVVIFCSLNIIIVTIEATWCVVRSDASAQALQRGLDYACSYGADCVPIQSSGLCYLPNTIQNHASYAYNSFYQRKNEAPGSCGFSGTATIAKTDPSNFFLHLLCTSSCIFLYLDLYYYMFLSLRFPYHRILL